MKVKNALWILTLFAITAVGFAHADSKKTTIRATEISSKMLQAFEQGKLTDVIVEFRQGDRLPVTFQAEGDLIETSETAVSYVVVKRPFWIEASQSQILMSLDGWTYQPIKDLASGSFNVSANADQSGGGPANALNMVFKSYLK